jgi:2-octaprenyl-6-methoxyphenol hydroxylase
LAFGDGLHKIHPLAGQGLNMAIRDIKILKSIIEKRISLGLEINETILVDFTDRIKSYNFFFAEGIDFMEKYFSINNSNFNKYSKKVFNYINKNLFMKQIFVDFADKGIEHFIKSK